MFIILIKVQAASFMQIVFGPYGLYFLSRGLLIYFEP